jgi:hypothetical protein
MNKDKERIIERKRKERIARCIIEEEIRRWYPKAGFNLKEASFEIVVSESDLIVLTLKGDLHDFLRKLAEKDKVSFMIFTDDQRVSFPYLLVVEFRKFLICGAEYLIKNKMEAREVFFQPAKALNVEQSKTLIQAYVAGILPTLVPLNHRKPINVHYKKGEYIVTIKRWRGKGGPSFKLEIRGVSVRDIKEKFTEKLQSIRKMFR